MSFRSAQLPLHGSTSLPICPPSPYTPLYHEGVNAGALREREEIAGAGAGADSESDSDGDGGGYNVICAPTSSRGRNHSHANSSDVYAS